MEDKFWGSEEGIREQKEFMSELPKGWHRVLQKYRTTGGEEFESYLGDEYEFRKIKAGTETQAVRLYYDWEEHWQVFVAKKFQSERGRIVKITDYEHSKFSDFEQAKQYVLNLMREL